MTGLEDKLLVWKFNRGSREALLRIYERYKDDLVTLASALLFDPSRGRDVVHDVFVSFLEVAPKFRLTGSLKGYLAACVANRARNVNQAEHVRRTAKLDGAVQLEANVRGPDTAAVFGEQTKRLAEALEQLPYEPREALMLYVYSGVRFKAIARQQGVPVNTVYGRYRYGLRKLRSLLNHEVDK